MQDEKEKSYSQALIEIVSALIAMLVLAVLAGGVIGVAVKIAKSIYE